MDTSVRVTDNLFCLHEQPPAEWNTKCSSPLKMLCCGRAHNQIRRETQQQNATRLVPHHHEIWLFLKNPFLCRFYMNAFLAWHAHPQTCARFLPAFLVSLLTECTPQRASDGCFLWGLELLFLYIQNCDDGDPFPEEWMHPLVSVVLSVSERNSIHVCVRQILHTILLLLPSHERHPGVSSVVNSYSFGEKTFTKPVVSFSVWEWRILSSCNQTVFSTE